MAENAVIDKAGDLFDKKYFGVPFPLILVGVAGTAYVVRRLIKGQENAKDVDSYTPEGEGYAMDVNGNKFASAYTGQAGGVPFGSGSLTNALSSGAAAITPPTEINNEGWLRRAAEKLTNSGMWDATFVQTALQKYISGTDLNQRENAVISQAIKMEGQPPINVKPGNVQGNDSGYVATPVRILRNNATGGIYLEYSDGTLHHVTDMVEWAKLRGPNGIVKDLDVVEISSNDPILKRVIN